MAEPSRLPLAGVRVLAFSSFGAGPWATMMLADLGAEVIKIEDPATGGDTSRSVPPLTDGVTGDSLYFQSMNRNKHSLALDIRHPQGREIFHRLVRVSEVVYNNLRGDQPRKLGLDYQALGPVNPRIVCVSCSGYGNHNSKAAEPGYDFIMQALTGYMSLTGEPGAPPARCGVSVVDFAVGLISLVGLLGGLVRARETGRGGDAETSLYEGALSMLNYLAAWNLNLGLALERRPNSAHQTIVPVQTFPTRDGWIFVMCMKDKFYQLLCEGIGRPELAHDPRFRALSDRYQRREELVAILSEVLKQRRTDEWMERLQGKIPCAPVHDLDRALRDPFVDELGIVWEIDHPEFGSVRQIGCPIQLPGTEPLPRRPAPKLGADTDSILKQLLELSDQELRRLRDSGAVGDGPSTGLDEAAAEV